MEKTFTDKLRENPKLAIGIILIIGILLSIVPLINKLTENKDNYEYSIKLPKHYDTSHCKEGKFCVPKDKDGIWFEKPKIEGTVVVDKEYPLLNSKELKGGQNE